MVIAQHFLLFPQCFQNLSLEVIDSRDCLVKGLTLHRTILSVKDSEGRSLLKTCEKKQMLESSNVVKPFRNESNFVSHTLFVVCKCSISGQDKKKCRLVKSYNPIYGHIILNNVCFRKKVFEYSVYKHVVQKQRTSS